MGLDWDYLPWTLISIVMYLVVFAILFVPIYWMLKYLCKEEEEEIPPKRTKMERELNRLKSEIKY